MRSIKQLIRVMGEKMGLDSPTISELETAFAPLDKVSGWTEAASSNPRVNEINVASQIVRIDSTGTIVEGEGAIGGKFRLNRSTGVAGGTLSLDSAADLELENLTDGQSVVLLITGVAGGGSLALQEDADLSDRTRINIAPGVNGARLRLGSGMELYSEGASGGIDAIRMGETAAPAEDLGQDTHRRVYFKGDKFIIQTNNGGTYRYYTIDLTATADQQIVHTTTAP